MEIVLVLVNAPQTPKEEVRYLSTIYRKVRTFADTRYHWDCNTMANEGARISKRLRTWFHNTDFFSNRPNMDSIARYSFALQEGILMAKKTTPQNTYERAEWKGFLEYQMSDAELEAGTAWELGDADLLEGIVSLTGRGYKLTASYNAKSGAATATLMAGQEQGRLSGYALSAKGTDARDAMKLLFYKHWHILDEDWSGLLEVGKRVTRG